jgi:hypothetical protein
VKEMMCIPKKEQLFSHIFLGEPTVSAAKGLGIEVCLFEIDVKKRILMNR